MTDQDFLDSAELFDLTAHYIAAALWSTLDDNGEALDANYTPDDLSPETRIKLEQMVTKAALDCHRDLPACLQYWSFEQFAHDLWLTQNGHGAGFWDKNYRDFNADRGDDNAIRDIGDALSAYADKLGGIDLYVGDDGLIYC